MRIEGNDCGQRVIAAGALDYATKDFLVAQMYAIEVADGDHGAARYVTEMSGPFGRRAQNGERHAISDSRTRPSYESRTFLGSFALAASWPRSWQMCVNHAWR